MNSSVRLALERMLGRLIALIFLITFLPTLLLIVLLLRSNSGEPVVLTDEVLPPGEPKANIHRFRTTGPGNNAFRIIGRFLRSFGYDDLPALWDVLRGRIGLIQLYRLDRKQ